MARAAALTDRFDRFRSQPFKVSVPTDEFGSPCRAHKRGDHTGQAEDGEDRKGDKWEDHGGFTTPGFTWRASEYLTFLNAGCSLPGGKLDLKTAPTRVWQRQHSTAPTVFTGLLKLRHKPRADVFSATPHAARFALRLRQTDVKLGRNFTSQTGFRRAENQALFLRRMLIISHKHNLEG